MDENQEYFVALTTLRIARVVSSNTLYYYVKPSTRIDNPSSIVSVVDGSNIQSCFANDQALIELFGKLGAV